MIRNKKGENLLLQEWVIGSKKRWVPKQKKGGTHLETKREKMKCGLHTFITPQEKKEYSKNSEERRKKKKKTKKVLKKKNKITKMTKMTKMQVEGE